jgi:hypothetical protein
MTPRHAATGSTLRGCGVRSMESTKTPPATSLLLAEARVLLN